ncbi:hypothetical protein QFC19_008001 [Naganishia cerealis]|uniref:Uncharacterized protein n=1 Tax=Naganishia cerealis TaxID=610337 RepID=A0ACC2V6P1_9TREE|nr:hypothetical protein QFC19_008001 [Naganishia cerealis]
MFLFFLYSGVRHLQELKTYARQPIAVNQIEQREIVAFCRKNGIALEAYSPLAQGKRKEDPVLREIAEEVNRPWAQVLIRWSLQHGFIPLPKSDTPERIVSNKEVYDFALSASQMARLDSLEEDDHPSWPGWRPPLRRLMQNPASSSTPAGTYMPLAGVRMLAWDRTLRGDVSRFLLDWCGEMQSLCVMEDVDECVDIYVFNFDAKSWSKQSTSSAPGSLTKTTKGDAKTDCNHISELQTFPPLDLGTITKTASSSAAAWEAVSSTSFQQGGQGVVMAEASNHINFFNVPNNPAGSTSMFVIHYSYFQPDAVTYKTVNNAAANFPTQHGKAIPVPAGDNSVNIPSPHCYANDVMVFVPDDFSNSYVVTHWTSPSTAGQTSDAPAGISNYINSTQTFSAPTSHDVDSSYAASDTAMVQIDSTGALYYVTGAFGNGWEVPSGLSWKKLGYTLAGVSGSNTSSTAASSSSSSAAATSSGSASSRTQSASRTASGGASTGSAAASASPSTKTSGALRSFTGVDVALVSMALSCFGLALAL